MTFVLLQKSMVSQQAIDLLQSIEKIHVYCDRFADVASVLNQIASQHISN
jgi:hypothetical protein